MRIIRRFFSSCGAPFPAINRCLPRPSPATGRHRDGRDSHHKLTILSFLPHHYVLLSICVKLLQGRTNKWRPLLHPFPRFRIATRLPSPLVYMEHEAAVMRVRGVAVVMACMVPPRVHGVSHHFKAILTSLPTRR